MGINKLYTLMTQPLLSLGVEAIFKNQTNFLFEGGFSEYSRLISALSGEVVKSNRVVFLDFVQDFDAYGQLIQGIRSTGENTYVILLLSQFSDEALVLKALRLGADGYLLQSASPEAFREAVTTVLREKAYLEPQMTPTVLAELRKPAYSVDETEARVELTHRERMLMQLTADGLSNVQIAEVLGLAEKTVRNLWSAVFDKVGFNDRTLVVLWAIRTGYVELR